MTYNGVGMGSIKGTGLSGYVQRSRVAVRQQGVSTAVEERQAADAPSMLEAARSTNENAALASILAQHNRLRALKIELLLHKQHRISQGAEAEIADEEARLMGESFLSQFREENAIANRDRHIKTKARDAQTFADAFAVESSRSAFDKAKRDEEKSLREATRRASAEQKLMDRAKKIRLE